MLGIGFLGIFSCAGPHSSTLPKSEQVVVIIENCPIQTSTNKVGHNISQTAYSTIDYIDKDGNLIEYNPCLAGRHCLRVCKGVHKHYWGFFAEKGYRK